MQNTAPLRPAAPQEPKARPQPARPQPADVLYLGLSGVGKTSFRLVGLYLLIKAISEKWFVLPGDGGHQDLSALRLERDLRRLRQGRLLSTRNYNRNAYRVMPRHGRGEPIVIREVDPPGEWVGEFLASPAHTHSTKVAELEGRLRQASALVLVIDPSANNVQHQLALTKRALDVIAPIGGGRGIREDFAHLTIAIVLTHWTGDGQALESYVKGHMPDLRRQLELIGARATFFGIDSYGGVASEWLESPGTAAADALPPGVLPAFEFVVEAVFHQRKVARLRRWRARLDRTLTSLYLVALTFAVFAVALRGWDAFASSRAANAAKKLSGEGLAEQWAAHGKGGFLPASSLPEAFLEPGRVEARAEAERVRRAPARAAFWACRTAKRKGLQLRAAIQFLRDYAKDPLAEEVDRQLDQLLKWIESAPRAELSELGGPNEVIPLLAPLGPRSEAARERLERVGAEESELGRLEKTVREARQVAQLDGLRDTLRTLAASADPMLKARAKALQQRAAVHRQELVLETELRQAFAAAGKQTLVLERDVVWLSRLAPKHAGSPREGRLWTKLAELLERIDARVRSGQGSAKQISLPPGPSLADFEAAVKEALRRFPDKGEALRRVLEHDLKAVAFCCPRCPAESRGSLHDGCGGEVYFRDGKLVCERHPDLVLSGGRCSCGYTWEH